MRLVGAHLRQYARDGRLFLIAYGMWLCVSICGTSLVSGIVPGAFSTGLKYFSLLLLAFSAVQNGLLRRRHDWAVLAALAVLAVLVRAATGSSIVLFLTAFIYCARDVEIDRIARCTIAVTSITCVIIVLLSQAGLLLDYIWDPGTRNRHGLGFLYCTTISHYLLNVSIALCVLRRAKMSWAEVIILLIVNTAILLLTDSKNSFALVLLVIAFCIVTRFTPVRILNNEVLLRALSQWSFLVFFVAGLLLCTMYDSFSPWMASFNEALAGRLSQTQASLANYYLLPFGQELHFMGNGLNADGSLDSEVLVGYDTNYVDNSYISIILGYGFVTLALLVALLVAAGGRVARCKNWPIAAALFVFALHSVFDPQMMDLQFSFALFTITLLVPGQKMVVQPCANQNAEQSRLALSK